MIPIDLKDQVAIVTGVSSGIGAGVAARLAQAGCNIAGCALDQADSPGVIKLLKAVESIDRECLYEKADVTSTEEISHFIDKTKDTFGRIDILFSNAGMNVFKGAEEASEKDWDFNMNLNLKSHWIISKLCKPYLAESPNGIIIINTSNHAYSTIPGCFPYNVSKTGLAALVQSLAIEWGPEIRTIGIAPGFIFVEGTQAWFDSFPDPEAELKRTILRHPAGKIGTPEDIGNLCAFLASEYAGFITGTTYLIDGGRSALMQDEQ